MEFHEIVRGLRQDREPKVTQTDVAKILNTTQRKISRIETGEAEPNIADIKMLCEYYNVSADYLLGLPRNMPYPKR